MGSLSRTFAAMKKIHQILWALALVFVLTGCDEELILTANWQDIPVVYGLIDVDEDTSYVRVERLFFDQNGSAFDAAANPDSLYYTNIGVRIQNMTTGQTVNLQRVNGADFGLVRDPGVFATEPNILYRFLSNNFPMNGGDELRLILDRENGQGQVTADALVLEPLAILGSLAPGVKLDFNPTRETSLRWRGGTSSRIFDVSLKIQYVEQEISNPSNIQTHVIDWKVARNVRRTNNSASAPIEARVLGGSFYQILRSSIPDKPGYRRFFQGMDLTVVGAGEALENYILISQANTGITSSQEIPRYSNLSEGLGIFTTTTSVSVLGLQLTQQTLDSLRFGSVTGSLNFQ